MHYRITSRYQSRSCLIYPFRSIWSFYRSSKESQIGNPLSSLYYSGPITRIHLNPKVLPYGRVVPQERPNFALNREYLTLCIVYSYLYGSRDLSLDLKTFAKMPSITPSSFWAHQDDTRAKCNRVIWIK